jgi:hypothetical protein
VIGALVHLVLDAAWADPEAFWWPLFGLDFPHVADSAFPDLVRAMLTNPWVWVGETIGVVYLVGLWREHLRDPGSLRRFVRDGRVPMPTA